ncbi:MAG: SPW repeat protein [Clostridia bacterium]
MKAHAIHWQDWAAFGLGLWLAVSPWALGYTGEEAATGNAAIVGLVLALGSHFEASFEEGSAEWLNLAAGLWLVAAPFVLGFTDRMDAAANSVTVGAVVTALAGSALSLDKEIGRFLLR